MKTHSLLTAVVVACMGSSALGQLVVNPPIAITRRILVNPIISETTAGVKAVYFGTPAQASNIKAMIKTILAQSGCDVHFLPERRHVDNFTYDGGVTGTTARPTGDLNTIISQTQLPKFLDTEVVNLILVRICPGFDIVTENTVNGLAFIDRNGTTVHVGASLLSFLGGREVIAEVVAHEIGHNLGLSHEANGGDNLMSPSGTSAKLTTVQTTTVLTDDTGKDGFDFVKPISTGTAALTSWISDNSLTGGQAGDDDKDSTSNLDEFAFGLDPRRPDSQLAPSPQVPLSANASFRMIKDPAALSAGMTYRVENSANLSTWLSQGQSGGRVQTVTDDTNELAVTLLANANQRSFFRAGAALPPAAPFIAGTPSPAPAARRVVSRSLAADPAPTEPVISQCHVNGCGCRHMATP